MLLVYCKLFYLKGLQTKLAKREFDGTCARSNNTDSSNALINIHTVLLKLNGYDPKSFLWEFFCQADIFKENSQQQIAHNLRRFLA